MSDIVKQLPPGLPSESESSRQFILNNVDEEELRKSGLSTAAKVIAVAAVLLSLSLGLVIKLLAGGFLGVVLVALGMLVVLIIRGMFNVAVRAGRLGRAGHPDAAVRTWGLLVLEIALFVATFVPTAIQLEPLRMNANESAAIGAMRTLNTAEVAYNVTYPDTGFACQLKVLGGSTNSGPATAESAQIIAPELALGRYTGYVFQISDCSKTSYKITAVPTAVGRPAFAAFALTRKDKFSMTGRAAPIAPSCYCNKRSTGILCLPRTRSACGISRKFSFRFATTPQKGATFRQ